MRNSRCTLVFVAFLLTGVIGAISAWPDAGTVRARSGQESASAGTATVFRNLEYSRTGSRSLMLDVYRPGKSDEPFPLVIWIHGGGWHSGSRTPCPAAWLVQHGYAVASIDYRLSREATFPAQIVDCKAAIRWLRAHAAEHGIDPDRVGVWGASAGGHLAALLGTAGDVPLFDSPENPEHSSRVQAVCDFFGPTYLVLSGTRDEMGRVGMESVTRLLGGPAGNLYEKAALASPATFVTPDDPPFLIVHGSRDPVVPLAQSRLLFDALQNAGVDATLHVVEGAGHGFRNFGVNDMVLGFFEKHLKSPVRSPRP